MEQPGSVSSRVTVAGWCGAINDTEGDVRAASRGRDDPDGRRSGLGFRVVVSPFSSDL